MRRIGTVLAPLLFVWCVVAVGSPEHPIAGEQRVPSALPDEGSSLVAVLGEIRSLLDQAVAARDGERSRLLGEVSRRLDTLALDGAATRRGAGSAVTTIPDDTRLWLQRIARDLRVKAKAGAPFSAKSFIDELNRVEQRLKVTEGLGFQGSYSEARIAEPAYGGHASAMGPPPVDPNTFAGVVDAPLFEVASRLPIKTFAGGRTRAHILESGGSGIALFDYDADGDLDIFVVNAFELDDKRERIEHASALFRNIGGWKFEDVSAAAGVNRATWGNGVCVGDVDDDGRLDVYVTNYGPNLLYRNRGDGRFEDVAPRAGVQAGGWSTGCAFLDADADGDLDLYVARYVSTTWDEVVKAQKLLTWRGGPKVMVGPVGLKGEPDVFFRNRGDGTFEDATDAVGLTDAARSYGFGVLATDYNGDGWVDLFVANDTNPNFLYRNERGRFASVGLISGVGLNAEGRAQAGMGVDAGDYDGDGNLDLVVTNFAHDNDTLYRSAGDGSFEDVSVTTGVATPTFVPMGWGVAFLDANLDGRPDLFVANGHIYPEVEAFPKLGETFEQKNLLLLNAGGRFVDVSARAGSGLEVRKSSRGLAAGDLDSDGDVDVVVSNIDDEPTLLENRQQSGRHWVGFALERMGPNKHCIGARVTVRAGSTTHVREVRSGGGYLSQNDLRVHVGLGPYSGSVDVEVQMPGGARWNWQSLAIDRYARLILTGSGTRTP